MLFRALLQIPCKTSVILIIPIPVLRIPTCSDRGEVRLIQQIHQCLKASGSALEGNPLAWPGLQELSAGSGQSDSRVQGAESLKR